MTDRDIRREWERHFDDILPKADLDRAFTKVMADADNMERAHEEGSNTRRQHKIRRMALTFAAAAAMMVVVPWATLKVNGHLAGETAPMFAEAPQMCEISTHNGEMREVILPDGSKVMLNAGSVIIYPEEFRTSKRSVFLSGEAIFDVTHDTDKPFIVSTSDIDIQVHGTVFNVNAYPESERTSATLCKGSISATLKRDGKCMELIPDERLSYDRRTGEAAVAHVNSAEDTAWERGDMCFRSENIHNIARAIERKYGINTYITSGKYDDMILTAKFVHGETLDQMLGAICKLVPGMRYRIENDSVYIR